MEPDERLPHCGMTRAEIERRVAAARAAQGLPRYIEDRTTLRRIAQLLRDKS